MYSNWKLTSHFPKSLLRRRGKLKGPSHEGGWLQRDVATDTTPSHWEIPLNPIRIGSNGFRQIVLGLAAF